MKLALVILLTGIVVVFSVLVLLIVIIKAYSTAVSSAQNRIEEKKIEKEKAAQEVKKASVEEQKVEEPEPAEELPDGVIPGEIVAAIAAAVDTVFGENAVTITSIKRAKPQKTSKRRSAWRSAGIAENTRAFRI